VADGGVTPAIGTGILSVIVLAAAFAGLYVFHLEGPWRWIYLVSAAIALYLNVFVLIIQAFLKIPPLHALAPNGNEPPFAIVQGIVLVVFVIGGFMAVRRYRTAAG
jgi:MFS family permease